MFNGILYLIRTRLVLSVDLLLADVHDPLAAVDVLVLHVVITAAGQQW